MAAWVKKTCQKCNLQFDYVSNGICSACSSLQKGIDLEIRMRPIREEREAKLKEFEEERARKRVLQDTIFEENRRQAAVRIAEREEKQRLYATESAERFRINYPELYQQLQLEREEKIKKILLLNIVKIPRKKSIKKEKVFIRILSPEERLEDKRNKSKKWQKEKREKDPIFKLKGNLRNRVNKAVRQIGDTKDETTMSLVGCDTNTLKMHLESQFNSGMTWENYGQWELDHIIPFASAKSKEEVYKLCHYTNLQPLWAEDNLTKNDKMPDGTSARANKNKSKDSPLV